MSEPLHRHLFLLLENVGSVSNREFEDHAYSYFKEFSFRKYKHFIYSLFGLLMAKYYELLEIKFALSLA